MSPAQLAGWVFEPGGFGPKSYQRSYQTLAAGHGGIVSADLRLFVMYLSKIRSTCRAGAPGRLHTIRDRAVVAERRVWGCDAALLLRTEMTTPLAFDSCPQGQHGQCE